MKSSGHPSNNLQILAFDPLDRVTGSCSLIHHPASGQRVLIDCGAYQGEGDDLGMNQASFPFDPSVIDHVLLTHGHLDHCGRLPLLVARGFSGPVRATRETIEVAKVVLADAVKIVGDPLLEAALQRINWWPVGKNLFSKPTVLGMDLFAFAHRSAHIVGAVSWEVVAGDPKSLDRQRGVVFSGDIGCNTDGAETQPWLRYRMRPRRLRDLVVMESTYGNTVRDPNALDGKARRSRLVDSVQSALARGGSVILPVFAVQRAQDVLLDLHLAAAEHPGFLDGVPLLVDGPMALRLHPILSGAIQRDQVSPRGKVRPTWLSKAFFEEMGLDRNDPVDLKIGRELLVRLLDVESAPNRQLGEPPTVREIGAELARVYGRSGERWERFTARWHRVHSWYRDSLIAKDQSSVVLATGGMASGGPVTAWLATHLRRADSTVLFTGYCSGGTLGGQLQRLAGVSAEERSRLHGRLDVGRQDIAEWEVCATLGRLSGWSGHADQRSLVDWLLRDKEGASAPMGRRVWVQHGESYAREALKTAIECAATEDGVPVRVELPRRDGLAWDLLSEAWVDPAPALGQVTSQDDALIDRALASMDPEVRRALERRMRS